MDKKVAFTKTLTELSEAREGYIDDAKKLAASLATFGKKIGKNIPSNNEAQHAARKAFDSTAEKCKGLIKRLDLLFKLASRVLAAVGEMVEYEGVVDAYDRKSMGKLLKQLDEARHDGVERLRQATYFYRQIFWLQDRFPKAEMLHVPGLVKVVTRKEIAAADWSLTPGRYVGIAPAEDDDEFDFEHAIMEIHEELAELNTEAFDLAATIQNTLSELGI